MLKQHHRKFKIGKKTGSQGVPFETIQKNKRWSTDYLHDKDYRTTVAGKAKCTKNTDSVCYKYMPDILRSDKSNNSNERICHEA